MFNSVSWLSRQVIDSKLKQLTTATAVAQFASQQTQLIKQQVQTQKARQSKTENNPHPNKGLSSIQKTDLGVGITAGDLVVIGVAAKVISSKNKNKNQDDK